MTLSEAEGFAAVAQIPRFTYNRQARFSLKNLACRLLSIGEAAAVKGVSIDTLRRWEKEGKIQSVRTQGGHRRYDIDTLIDFKENRKTIAYARVSSHDQKNDLERQALLL
nr:MerR family DNA-binding transcriptional regulator [Coleofasciculus chthonoplastes]